MASRGIVHILVSWAKVMSLVTRVRSGMESAKLPIVLFIITLNISLALVCLWIAQKIVQWKKSLTQINQSLTVAELSLRNRLQSSTDPKLGRLQTQVEQLHSQIQPQLMPLLQFLSATYRVQRLWSKQKLRSSISTFASRISTRQSARNPRRR